MKKSILSILAVTALLFSCSDDDNGGSNVVEFQGGSRLAGTITGKVTLDASVAYELPTSLTVAAGSELIIPAGTKIAATGGTASYIAVERGAQIFVNGEANNPVLMTSGEATPENGDWGGLVICGDAVTNLGEDVLSEVGNLTYGGKDNADSSGSLKYLRIEYTGAKFNASKEFNGISFFGVGSGTIVENIYAFESGDDGLEFFGGAVNAKNLAIENAYDDSLDFADGYQGTIDGLYIVGVTKAGIEGSNNGDSEAKLPETNATIKNVTVVKGDDFGASENVINYKEGGGKQTYSNLVFSGFTTFAKFSSDDVTAANITAKKFTVVSYNSADVVNDANNILPTAKDASLKGAGNGAGVPTWLAAIK